MARMHSRKKGKSGTKRPKRKENVPWVDPQEVKAVAQKLAKQGIPPSKIGLILRDQYGVPSFRAATGKKLKAYLEEEGLYKKFPEDLLQLFKKAVRMREHLKKNKKDVHNKVKLSHTESKIMRLLKYYKKIGKVPADWHYDPEQAALLIR
jgi:small subunit ribosomal protein S15